MIYLLIIYVASYILMEILWVYILEEGGSFLDDILSSKNWWCLNACLANSVIIIFLPLITIWGYYSVLEEKLEGLDKDD